MRILIATGIYPPDVGGPAGYSALLEKELPKRGVAVKILSFGWYRGYLKILRHFIYFLRVIKLGRDCDIIYAQDPVSVGLPAIFASKYLGKKFAIKIVGDYAWEQGIQRFGVKELLSSSAIFLLNTGYEGFSHQILEAMALGLPIITTNAGGNKEIVENEKNALVVEYNNKEAWTRGITRLINDENLQKRLSEGAKTTAQKFLSKDMINETIKVLESILHAK